MKQPFLNQKLGKRMSRKANLQKAKLLPTRGRPSRKAPPVGNANPAGKLQ